ncbi:hypothetical protein, partial [Caballeronia sp. INML3]|uniref:hypothetical protein n=1 Tax=Caballeronia sp. INML3 TaxID=2921752 RepID=UPI00203300C7
PRGRTVRLFCSFAAQFGASVSKLRQTDDNLLLLGSFRGKPETVSQAFCLSDLEDKKIELGDPTS